MRCARNDASLGRRVEGRGARRARRRGPGPGGARGAPRSCRRGHRSRRVVAVIEVDGLVKRYGDVVAVDGISFTVEAGEIFALLGPNGAGKTTTVEILEGYRGRDAGEVCVLGEDPGRA